ncbi:MAG: LAO/AO transport system kinase [Bacteroidia bacterium]|jgi:LAO/AO transport system kinase
MDLDLQLVQGVKSGSKAALARAITLVESALPNHRAQAQALIAECLNHPSISIRIAVTGTPGVGKSTFINKLGTYLIENYNKKVAVLAIDPSSKRSGGSILGDKTRMPELTINPNAFIRPSASGDALGGVASKTRETILLCEAAGFDVIIVETVGVGQSETTVHSMVDFFLLLLQPGAGDELQGIKKGIVEMADLLVVNKADGDKIGLAKESVSEYRKALSLLHPVRKNWKVAVESCSSISGEGLLDVWSHISEYELLTKDSGAFDIQRKAQLKAWFDEEFNRMLQSFINENEELNTVKQRLEKQIQDGSISPSLAAIQLLKKLTS